MGKSSREWDVSKELEGGSYYLHKDYVQETPNVTGQPRVRKYLLKISGRYLIVCILIAPSTSLTSNYYVMATKFISHKK